MVDERASDASSASLNLPGRNQVRDLREDSRLEMVDTLFTRKDSYFASEKDMDEREEAGRRMPSRLWKRIPSLLVHRGKSTPTGRPRFSSLCNSCPGRPTTSSPAPCAASSIPTTPTPPPDRGISRPPTPSMNSRYASPCHLTRPHAPFPDSPTSGNCSYVRAAAQTRDLRAR